MAKKTVKNYKSIFFGFDPFQEEHDIEYSEKEVRTNWPFSVEVRMPKQGINNHRVIDLTKG